MGSYDSQSAQAQYDYEMARLQEESSIQHNFTSPSNQSINMLGLSTDGIASIDASAYVAYSNTQQAQQFNNSNTNPLFYEQNQIPNAGFLQQPSISSFSNQSIHAGSYSPSTAQEHFSPGSYVSDFASPGHLDSSNLEQDFAKTQINSPLVMSDDGHTSFQSPDFPSNGTSHTEVNFNAGPGYFPNQSYPGLSLSSVSQPTSTHLNGQTMYSTDQRPSQLSLNVPHFGNTIYDSQNTGSANASSIDLSEVPPHMKSPIVRIENCDDVPNQSSLSRSLSRRSHGSKRSNQHLSPYEEDESSDDGSVTGSISAHTATRNDDGAWVQKSERATGGLSPIHRSALNNQEIQSPDEQAELRKRAEHNARVTNWLTHSAHGSEDEDDPQPKGHKNRPRARSTNDIAAIRNLHSLQSQQAKLGFLCVPPGPGIMVNETSDYGDEDEEEITSVYSHSASDTGSPVADVATRIAEKVEFEIPAIPQRLPWEDLENGPERPLAYTTSNAALMAYYNKAKEFDTVSLATTIGTKASRRRSISDIDSLFSHDGTSRQVTSASNQSITKEKKGISNYFSNMIPRSTSRKRKSESSTMTSPPIANPAPSNAAAPSGQRRLSNLVNRPRTPKLNTDLPITGIDSRSPIMAAASAISSKIRSRSKSDTGRTPGIADMWQSTGGPPVGYLAAPAKSFGTHQVSSPHSRRSGNDSDDDEDGVDMDLSVRQDMTVIPTYEGFQRQIQILNPRVDLRILDRLVQEQVKRYRRLVDARTEHQRDALSGKCASEHLCAAHGGQPEPITAKPGGKGAANLPIFQIVPPGTTLDNSELPGDAQAATFRGGVPQPPVQTLPSRFECQYCFQAKDFKKPSDWTKHIHEDVQPFTCTFPDCNDPKSFKRKADWVRHESERHRQLESWTCNFEDCTHVCYRRDNFVQHLVREHKVPEPKIRTGRHGGTKSPAWSPKTPVDFGDSYGPRVFRTEEEASEAVSKHVENCKSDSTKDPSTEPCRFCGNILKSWKQLTVHLAKHMEQIAMPIIPLVEQHPGARNASQGFHQQQRMQQIPTGIMPGHPSIPINTPSGPYLYDEPGEMDNTPTIAISGPSQTQYSSFPPANFSQMLELDNTFASSMNGGSFPPALLSTRSRGSSIGENYSPQRLDTTYPPLSMMSTGGYNGDANQGMNSMILLGMEQPSKFGQQNQQNQQNQQAQQNQNQQGQYGQQNPQQQFYNGMENYNG
jgi:hypothetical protein